MGRIVSPTESFDIGTFVMLSSMDKNDFKAITSSFSKDFIQTLLTLKDMHRVTNDMYYKNSFERALDYYEKKSPDDGVDYLFVSSLNEKNYIPKDILAAVKSIGLLKEKDKEIYYKKLKAILSSKYFRKEKEKGILTGSVLIENMNYIHSNENNKNQTLIEVDALFLEKK